MFEIIITLLIMFCVLLHMMPECDKVLFFVRELCEISKQTNRDARSNLAMRWIAEIKSDFDMINGAARLLTGESLAMCGSARRSCLAYTISSSTNVPFCLVVVVSRYTHHHNHV